jgi:hypothetical protein
MDYSDSSKSSRIKNKHKNSKNDNKHHHRHERERTRDKERRDRERDRERDRDREREIERERDRHYRSKSRGSKMDRDKRHKNKHSSKKEKSHLSKNHSNRHNHSSYRDNNKESGNSKKHYSNKSSHKSRSKYSSSNSSYSSSSNQSSSSSKQKEENTNNLNDTQTFNPYMMKNIIPPINQTKYPIPMNFMGFPSMMGGMIPMPGLIGNMIDNQPDKIVKDQNFLNSEEKLFESIVNHEMSLKNLYSDCQFSEKLMGSLLFRNLKKLIFDSNTVIFTDSKNEEKENVPSVNEIIDNRINNLLKEKYLKINFSGLDGIYNKIIEERKQKMENEKKTEKSK